MEPAESHAGGERGEQNILHSQKEKEDSFVMFDGYDSCSDHQVAAPAPRRVKKKMLLYLPVSQLSKIMDKSTHTQMVNLEWLPVRCVGWSVSKMLFTLKQNVSAVFLIQEVTCRTLRRQAFWPDFS
ncbi:hypothetical protein HispidOSU_001177 [Sigmodon hispidus]